MQQMRRARDLIDQKASIKEICAAVKDDPDYVSFADRKKGKNRNPRASKRKPKPVRLLERAEQQAHDAERKAALAAPAYVPEGPGALPDPPELGETRRREQASFQAALAGALETPTSKATAGDADPSTVEEPKQS